MVSPTGGVSNFSIDGKEFEGTPENVWDHFLDEIAK